MPARSGEGTAPTAETGGTVVTPAGAAPYTPYGQYTPRAAPVLGGKAARIVAAALLGAGIVLGVAGLFPAYIGAASLAQQADQVTSHAIYLAVWTVGAVLILLGGARLRIGALLGLGLSAVTFGLFLADAGTALVRVGEHRRRRGPRALNHGGSPARRDLWSRSWPARPARRPPGQPRSRGRAEPRSVPLSWSCWPAFGVAAAFAPAWDSFTLRTAAGQVQSLTAGNAFSNPGLVIAGDVAVMLALAAVVIAAALWRPVRHGAVLLAGATAAMAAQAISALVQVTGTPVPAQFGISSAQASQLGLTISAGLTPAFWIDFGFLVALIASCVWMLFGAALRPGRAGPGLRPAA